MNNSALNQALNVFDLRREAQRRLPKWMFDMLDRGTEDEVALRNNRMAFERIKIKTRVLIDVSKRSLVKDIVGKQHPIPLGKRIEEFTQFKSRNFTATNGRSRIPFIQG